jgi:rhamnulokinase
VEPGTVLGRLSPPVARATRLGPIPIVTPASHDTAAAVAAIPLAGRGAAYISSGTWSLVGVESDAPIVNDAALEANLTNEYGFGGTVRLLKNVTAMWLLHECQRTWSAAGQRWTVGELLEMAAAAPPFRSLVDPDHPSLLGAGDMPARIEALCEATGQPAPVDAGATVRCILESLALKYRRTLDALTHATGDAITTIHIVGGGARNALLSQWTADATGVPVLVGPLEATSVGNVLIQLIALGQLRSLADGRALVEASSRVVRYDPAEPERWTDPLDRVAEWFPEVPPGASQLALAEPGGDAT